MKVEELVAKVKILSMEEIDELVDNGIEIENIPQFILWDNEQMKETLFRNEKLKRLILKGVNSYAIDLFQEINKKPKWDMHPNLQIICKNYLKSFFKDGIELELVSEKGRTLLGCVLDARGKKQFIKEAALDNKIWGKYINALRKFSEKDMNELSNQQAKEYLATFREAMVRVIPGYNLPEAEAILKLVQRDDIEIEEVSKLDPFVKFYENYRSKGNIARTDEVFSIILDKDILQRKNGIERPEQYSPINEMVQAIENGTFGKNNSLSKEEFAFAFKMMQNPELLDNEIGDKLLNILENPNIQYEVGNREIKNLLDNRGTVDKISQVLPSFEEKILKQIEIYVTGILEDIEKEDRAITSEEMNIYSKYLRNYYEVCIDKHGDTTEMLRLFCLANDFGIGNNRVKLTDKNTSEFFKKQRDENKVFKRYMENIIKIGSELISEKPMTEEQFEQYDNIIKEFGYRCNICSANNVKIIEALEERSKQINKTSKAMEERIEIYIDQSLKGEEIPKQPEFYQAILEYYERQLGGSALEINANAAISHLISVAQKGRLPEDISQDILTKLETRKQKNQSIDIDNSQDFEQYMKNVAEIRLQQGKMPRECSETIIRKAILQEQYMRQYSGIVERALEDLAEYELEDAGIKGYPVLVLNQPLLSKKTWMGDYNPTNKTIKLSRRYLKSEGILEMLDTILHENTHAIQNRQIEDGQLNRDTYKMLKEKILRNENNDFYHINYKYMYNEIDARKSGYVKRNKLLKRMGIHESQIAELDAGNIEQKIAEYCKEYEKGKIKKVDTESKDVNTIFIELLQEKPEILSQFPELRVEYEMVGDTVQRRSLVDILVEYEQMLGQAKSQRETERISSLCSEILLNGGPILEEKMQEEIEQLMALESENEIINAFKDKLLLTRFPRQKVMAATVKRFYEKSSAEGRHEVQQALKQVARSKQNLINQEVENEGRED